MKRGWENLLHGVVAGLLLPAVASVYPQTAAAQDRTGELQNRLQEMEAEMRALQQELQQMKSDDDAKHKQLEEQVRTAEMAPAAKRSHKSMVFFRGGYADYVNNARGFESFTDTHNIDGVGGNAIATSLGLPAAGFPLQDAEGAWYVGASIEHSLSDDLWGLFPHTEALGEIGLEYKHFGGERAVLVVPSAECSLVTNATSYDALESDGGCLITGNQEISMFTVSAAPKIKFMQGSKLRPWIIPAGLDFNVISPPSDAATYLDVGVQFGAGVEYDLIPGIKVGIDGRYHLVSDISDTDNNTVEVLNRELAEKGLGFIDVTGDTDKELSFWTIGGYLGFTF